MSMTRVALLACVALVFASVAQCETYEGQQVIRFAVKTQEDADRVFSVVYEHGLDVWAENKALGKIDVRFTTISVSAVREQLAGIEYSVLIEDVQKVAEDMHYQNHQARMQWRLQSSDQLSGQEFFQSYHTYEEIIQFLNNMAATYPQLTTLEQIGLTVQGNPIVGIHIRSLKGPAHKPLVVYNSLQHAREWISGATTTYIIDTLLSGYGKSQTITQFVDSIDWFIVPVVNVDGYQWTWNPQGDRLWRKNRRPVTPQCFGIDTNRNWGFQFMPSPITDACKEIYAGKVGFSEPENSAIANFLQNHPATVAYIDFHSFSQLMMWPWAYQAPPPPHNELVTGLGNKMVEAIKSVSGTQYTGGQIYEVIYPAYGSSVDFALGVANVTLPYGIELRDTGLYGFQLPPNQIIPNGQEIFKAVETMARFIIDNNIKK